MTPPSAVSFLPTEVAYLDPDSISGMNLYAYCGNDPVNLCDPYGKFSLTSYLTGMGIAALTGALVGAFSYIISEGISYALTGESSWSWAQFAGNVLGGAIGGAVSVVIPGANIMIIAGITEAASTAIGMGLQNKFEGTNYSSEKILRDTVVNGLIGLSLAGLSDIIKIKGINKGRNSFAAIYKTINTKFYNGTISRISYKTFFKIFVYNMFGGLIGSAVNGILDAININD